ncbi:MAG: esterase/lipase family protein, partial [Vicinamibacteraceae bacterium]
MLRRRATTLMGLLLILVVGRGAAAAQGQQAEIPEPVRDPIYTNIFYGGALPTATTAPVLVFVHGFGGTAQYWWRQNDMHALAYLAGYRTAFISLSADGTPNNESIAVNAAVLRTRLPRILQHYRAEKLYLIGHSKGGVDIQAAMLDPATAALVRAVFTISSPNYGTELADWAFEHPLLARAYNLLTPAVNSLRTPNMEGFRELADPVLRDLGIPFYTTTGNRYTTNGLTLLTGSLLRRLAPGQHLDASNDGFVTVGRSRLSPEFATDLGVVPTHHFDTDTGTRIFTKIQARINGLENTLQIFERVATNGLSELGGAGEHSTWAWSVKWFKGKLYVGTASEALCVSVLTSDVRVGTRVYPAAVNTGQCPDYPELVRSLGAEIWQY